MGGPWASHLFSYWRWYGSEPVKLATLNGSSKVRGLAPDSPLVAPISGPYGPGGHLEEGTESGRSKEVRWLRPDLRGRTYA